VPLFGKGSIEMSRYMDELCEALVRVLDHCAELDRRRLAGYAANIDFWVSEIQHRLVLIDGYADRRRTMLSGTQEVYADDIGRCPDDGSLTTPNVVDTSTEWEALERVTAELRKKLLGSAKRFVMQCLATDLIDEAKLFQIEDHLQVNLRVRKPWEAK
jgi:hypothetical protein